MWYGLCVRHYFTIVTWVIASTLVGCGKKDAAGNPANASVSTAEATAATVRPRVGGSVVALGDYFAEVLPHADGQIEATLTDRSGHPIADPAKMSLVAHATAKGGAETDAKLAWEPARVQFVGHTKGGAKLASGPLKLVMTLQGKTIQGLLAMVPVVDVPHFGGRLLTVGDLGAEVMAHADGTISARLWDARLEPITDKVATNVEAMVNLGAGKTDNVTLHWDEPSARFEGRANFADVVAPIDLELRTNVGGKVNMGALANMAVVGNAHHNGVVLAVGEYSAELVAGAHGLIEAFVMDAAGKAHASGNLDVHFEMSGSPAVDLKWDPVSASYRGTLATGLDLRPIKLRIESGGHAYLGALARLKAAADADLNEAVKVEANAAANAQAKANAGVTVEPPSVHITPPKISAGVDALLSAGDGARANANAKAKVQAPSISVKPPSVKAQAGANVDAKARTQ